MIDFEKCCGKAVVGGATSTVGAAVGGVIGAVLGLFTD